MEHGNVIFAQEVLIKRINSKFIRDTIIQVQYVTASHGYINQLRVRSRSSSVLSAMFCRQVRTLQKRHGTNQQSLKRNVGKRGPSNLKACPPYLLCDCHGWTNATDSVALVHPLRFCRVPTRRQNVVLRMRDDRLLTHHCNI